MVYLNANWAAPSTIRALTTTRAQGVSHAPFEHNNLGLHVGDEQERVLQNRYAIGEMLSLPKEPIWLEQTHSNRCIIAEETTSREADAIVTRESGNVLAIMTADCLPILLCNQVGTEIAAIHAGWRGLANKIINHTLDNMQSMPRSLVAWIGPAICGKCYSVGENVQEAYLSQYPCTQAAFSHHNETIRLDLPKAAELILHSLGVHQVYQSEACTFERENDFYSYRRNARTGRMATLIWF